MIGDELKRLECAADSILGVEGALGGAASADAAQQVIEHRRIAQSRCGVGLCWDSIGERLYFERCMRLSNSVASAV